MITRGIRNNNPFNIRRTRIVWFGEVSEDKKTDKEFEQFTQMSYGLRAGILLLRNYIRNGYNTPEKIISRFAPPSENDTSKYLLFVLNNSDLDSDSIISASSLSFYYIIKCILIYESDYDLDLKCFENIVSQFKIDLK